MKAWRQSSTAAESSVVPTCRTRRNGYLDRLGLGVEDLFHHVLAVLHTTPPTGRPTPGRSGWSGPASRCRAGRTATPRERRKKLAASAARGRELAALLDSETPVIRRHDGRAAAGDGRDCRALTTTDGGNMAADDFSVTAGWGHFGQGEAVMPGQGRVVERPYTVRGAAPRYGVVATSALGDTTFDIHLNDRAYWRNVPADCVELQAGRVPGAQEVALLPRARGA